MLKLLKVDLDDEVNLNEEGDIQADEDCENGEDDVLNFDEFVDADSGEGKWVTIVYNVRECFKKIRKSEDLCKKLKLYSWSS